MMSFHVYKSTDGYRWRLVSNGKIMGDSGEAYSSRSNAKRAVKRIRNKAYWAPVVDG